MASDNKRIAKNTMFLYIRMFLIMGVTLYTSRVILDKLGVEDYGLYNVVGGVVGILSFLNGTLSIGSSRFITVALGRGNMTILKETFSTAFYSHLGLSLIMVVLLETIGLWFVFNELVIPDERFIAAVWVYQISIFTMVLNITQVPYTSAIMAHERMGIYAYVSIFEAIGKLVVCYAITMTTLDKLVMYSILLAVVQIVVMFIYRFYCIRNFEESRLTLIFNKSVFIDMMSFSGWNIIASISEMLNHQGVVVLMNLFFQPAIVGAQAFANNMSTSLMQFVNNFRSAINPNIIKTYAAGKFQESKKFTLDTTIYVFDMVLLLTLPCIFVMPKILDVWLVEVPDYTLFFCRWFLIYNIIQTFSTAFYIPMMAAGAVRTNSLFAVLLGIGKFVLLYVIWMLGASVEWVQYLAVLSTALFGLIVKPYVLVKECEGYTFKDIVQCFFMCFKIAIVAIVIPIVMFVFIDKESLLHNALLIAVCICSVVSSSILFMEASQRQKLQHFILKRLHAITNFR